MAVAENHAKTKAEAMEATETHESEIEGNVAGIHIDGCMCSVQMERFAEEGIGCTTHCIGFFGMVIFAPQAL